MHAAAVWLRDVRNKVPGGVAVDWRYFSLEQVNRKAGEGVNVWDRPDGFVSGGLEAFAASEAVRRLYGAQEWERLHYALLSARHTDAQEDLTRETVERVVASCRLDQRRVAKAMDDSDILEPLARDHAEAEGLGVFGTPTLVFPNGASAYLKMRPAPEGDEALQVWEQVRGIVEERQYISEIKRPKG